MKPQRSRPEGCLSDFAIDRRLAGELNAAAEAAAKTHLTVCARCTERAAELTRSREAFMNDAPPLRLATPPDAATRSNSRPRRVFAAGGSTLALAAGLALFLAFRSPAGGGGTRSKGEAAKLGFYVNHGGIVRLGGPGEHVRPGDGLRFVATSQETRYLAVLSVDGLRHASTYYPSSADPARPLIGPDIALAESTTLDEALGDETIYGVFCLHPFAPEPLRRALESNPDVPPAPEGCTVDILHLRKEASPEP